MESLPFDSYGQFLAELKSRIQATQLRASLAVNRELVLLYWQIGRDILDRQEREKWGARVIDRLAADLKRSFPDMKGFSPRNLKYIRVRRSVAGGANCASGACTNHLVPQCRDSRKADDIRGSHLVRKGNNSRSDWGAGSVRSKFATALPCRCIRCSSHSGHETLRKTPTISISSTLGDDAHERDLERGLLDHLRQLLLELGVGFAFVGSQYRLTIGNGDFFIDLLFYHLKLRVFVVVDLKMRAFEPEFAGKMNFYLSAVNDRLRHPDDQPSIGIILCKTRDRFVAEYALRDINKPIGISEYRLAESLPEKLKGSLPRRIGE
jgi:predicted nuclease of restriction endonuclease-like (RecB) superfamily